MTKRIDGRPSKQVPGYNTWKNMRQRCQNKNHPRYADWGGRGIQVCERWQTFANFHADMGDKPDGMSIERKDNDGDYTPDNCVWATTTEQNRNQRTRSDQVLVEGKPVSHWVQVTGVDDHTIRNRLRIGWTMQEIQNGERIIATETD